MVDAIHVEMGLNPETRQHEDDDFRENNNNQHGGALEKETHSGEKTQNETRLSADSDRYKRTPSGVNVEQAEKDFAELSRELSALSRRMSRTQSRGSGVKAKDLEKAVSSSDEQSEDAFDLESTLRGDREADSAAGIKSKYIGK